jgi:integrase
MGAPVEIFTQADAFAKNAIKVTDDKVITYSADAGLFLVITPRKPFDGTHTASWVLRYRHPGGQVKLGLGAFPAVDLNKARDKAQRARELKEQGKDPLEAKREQARKQAAAQACRRTFDECIDEYLKSEAKPDWTNARYHASWPGELRSNLSDEFRSTPVHEIDKDLVRGALAPIWKTKHITARRVRGRIEVLLDWAAEFKYRPDGDNPARWGAHRFSLLPGKKIGVEKKKMKAIEFRHLPVFMSVLRSKQGDEYRALEFHILCASRSNEALGAAWSELDEDGERSITSGDDVLPGDGKPTWIVPKKRMKGRRVHRVPLSTAAVEVLRAIRTRKDDAVFHSPLADYTALGQNALLSATQELVAEVNELLKKQGVKGVVDPGITAHGFRSAFKTWAGTKAAYPREVIEDALAHSLKNQTEASYQRGDYFERRRPLMEAWADYCAGKSADVINIEERRKAS